MYFRLPKLDRTSQILIVISLIGIIGSIFSLYLTDSVTSVASGDKIAKVTFYNNDTRLKRAGAFDWYSVSNVVDCFENDRIFTGENSYATIEYQSGAKVKILPNSLISLSKGNVSLNSGSIEVDLKKGKVAVESFGEKIVVNEKTKFRVENSENKKRIVSLDKSTTLETNPKLKNLIQDPKLAILTPGEGDQVPKFDALRTSFSWKFTSPNPRSNFRVDFSQDPNFQTILLTYTTLTSNLRIANNAFPTGMVHWRVVEVGSETVAKSAFFLNTPQIKLVQPLDKAVLPLKTAKTTGLTFEWQNSLSLPQKIQIAKTPDFSSLLTDNTVNATQMNYNLDQEGTYFWRVGYILAPQLTYWSSASQFNLRPEANLFPLVVTDLPNLLDFALTPSYQINLRDPNNCIEYDYQLTSQGKLISRSTTKAKSLVIKPLANGDYVLKVTGKLKDDERLATSRDIPFTVRNSPPLQAPKIKNKKNVKLFVRLMREAFDLILPSAEAQSSYYPLHWEAADDPNATYEIEIAKENKTVVIKTTTKEPSYKFYVPRPEKYYWRVRTMVGPRSSPFSEYHEITAVDKITTLSGPLMLIPLNKSTVDTERGQTTLKLTWREPQKNFTYYVEIFKRMEDAKPVYTFKAKGGSYVVNFRQLPRKFFWRVTAESQYKNKSGNQEKFVAFINKTLEPPIKFNLDGKLLYSQTNLTQKFETANEIEEDLSFTGPALNLKGEYFFRNSDHKRTLSLDARYATFTKGQNDLTDTRLHLEYGWVKEQKSMSANNYYLGYMNEILNYNLENTIKADYLLHFISGRYSLRRIISEKTFYELNASLLVALPAFLPSALLKPEIFHRIGKDKWLSVMLGYERLATRGQIEVSGASQTIDVGVQNIIIGVGISWRPEYESK